VSLAGWLAAWLARSGWVGKGRLRGDGGWGPIWAAGGGRATRERERKRLIVNVPERVNGNVHVKVNVER
jgi:hypothetical protein